MSIKLLDLTKNDSEDIYNLIQNINYNENGFNNEAHKLNYLQFKEWLIKQNDIANGKNIPENYVRQWIFWLYVDGVPIGIGKLREKLTEKSRKIGGNIVYAISKKYRGKGYGTILFKLLLEKSKELGIKEILSTVKIDNYSSIKIQEKCGGVLINKNEKLCYFKFETHKE